MNAKPSRFGQIKSKSSIAQVEPVESFLNSKVERIPKISSRIGKKAIVGYFSEELSREFYALAIKEGKTMQSLLGEAIDDLLRARGKNPFGER